MISRDPKCVFVGNTVSEATVVANWLEHEGIDTQVMDSLTHGGLDGLTAWTGSSARGIEVWVLNPAEIEAATELIEQHGQFRAALDAENEATEPVLAYCEECGQSATFPGEQLGSIQDCPHCGRYMDIVQDDVADHRTRLSAELPGETAASSMMAAMKSLQKPILLLALGGVAFYFFMLVASQIAVALGF